MYKGQACPAHQSTLELQWLVVSLRVAGALVPSAWVLSSRRQQQREYGQYGRVKDVVSSSQLAPTLRPSAQRLREYGLSDSSGRACGRLRPASGEKGPATSTGCWRCGAVSEQDADDAILVALRDCKPYGSLYYTALAESKHEFYKTILIVFHTGIQNRLFALLVLLFLLLSVFFLLLECRVLSMNVSSTDGQDLNLLLARTK